MQENKFELLYKTKLLSKLSDFARALRNGLSYEKKPKLISKGLDFV
jgi:hypothetical protein